MNELVSIKKMQGTENTVVSSLAVAEHFHKRHDRLLQSIEELYGDVHDFVGMFKKSTYKDKYGRNKKWLVRNMDREYGCNGQLIGYWLTKFSWGEATPTLFDKIRRWFCGTDNQT